MAMFLPLARIVPGKSLLAWFMAESVTGKLGPAVSGLLQNTQAAAEGALHRVGDALIWKGTQGQTVLAHLESLANSETRIEQAVNGLGVAQTAIGSTLGAVHTLSMLTLGVTSLTGAFMLWRLNALKQRYDALAQSIQDLEGHLTAIERAHIQSAVTYLDQYENQNRTKDSHLEKALGESRQAANIYKNLVSDEAHGPQRLEVLNYRGRMYLLGLLTELRCCILAEDLKTAHRRIEGEEGTLSLVAKTTFAKTIGPTPEEYLRPDFIADGITLDVLAEVYSQAHTAGAVGDEQVRNAAELFERLRGPLAGRRHLPSLPRMRWQSWKEGMLRKFRYAVCCIEETNRVRSLKLLLEEAKSRSLCTLADELATWKAEASAAAQSNEVLAYRLA